MIGQVEVFKASVKEHAQKLAVEQHQVSQLVAMRHTQQRSIEVRLSDRRRLLSSVNGEIAQLVHEQEVAQMISARRISPRSSPSSRWTQSTGWSSTRLGW